MNETRCGFIAIIGRPNVGKSTLLNTLVGHKLSIISKKPQTTRHKISGIKTLGQDQLVFVDTPGLHRHPKHKINQMMIKTARKVLRDVDVIIFMVNKQQWTDNDELILHYLTKVKTPFVVVINKIDRIKEKDILLPIILKLKEKFDQYQLEPKAIIPLSAKFGQGVLELENELLKLIPNSPHFFPPDQKTDRSERFWAAEIIREKLMRLLGEEVPHTITVEIELFQREEKLLRISAIIWVERQGQKAIVIGTKGEVLKQVGYLARQDMEREFNQKVFLQLWVKVKAGWTDDIRALRSLGYDEQ